MNGGNDRILTSFALAALIAPLSPGLAHAAGNERNPPSAMRTLFEDGRYLEFSIRHLDPTITGTGGLPAVTDTGNMVDKYQSIGAALKADITPQLSYALILDQPWGNNATYRKGTGTGDYLGTKSEINSYQVTGLLAYDVTPNTKVFGGVRAQRIDAAAEAPFVAGYEIDTNKDWEFGYILGAAYHIPEIALRVGLTYTSEIKHTFDITEDSAATPVALEGDMEVRTPQTVMLDFQSGIAPDTLLFGSVRWVDWSVYEITPPHFSAISGGATFAGYLDDWWTYDLGIGRRFDDNWSGALQLTYEPDAGSVQPTTGPYDGRRAVTGSVQYDTEQFRVSAGLSYGKLGKATNSLGTEYSDGDYWAAGLRLGYKF